MMAALLILFAICAACNAQEVSVRDLQVQAIGNCCPVGGGPCEEGDCPEVTDQIENIADGDALTELVIDFISQDDPEAEITLDLGQVFTISSLTLLSTTQLLPRNWSLSFSQGNSTFDQVTQYSNEGVYEQEASLVKIQASLVQLSIELPSMASPSPVAIAEVIITVSGSGLEEERGCGVCVEGLVLILDEIGMVIDNSSSLLGSINTTQEELLQGEIMESQLSVDEYEDALLVLGVVLGVEPPLNDAVDISPNVIRLDLLLVPAIPVKLNELEALLDSINELDIDTGDLETLLDMIEPSLEILLSNLTELTTNADTQRDSFTSLVDALGTELDTTVSSLMLAMEILEVISSRNFSAEAADLQRYQTLTETAASLSIEVWNSITAISNQAESVNVSLSNLRFLLEETLDITLEAIRQSNDSLENVDAVDAIIQEIQDLLSEAISLNSTLQEAIDNATENLLSARESLQMANVLLQTSESLLSNLTMLTELLRASVEEYTSQLSPYQLPPSCNSSVCTESERHAENLATNSSEIVSSPTTIYTLQRAREFLENIEMSGELFNYTEINEITSQAQMIAQEGLGQLSMANITSLDQRSSQISTDTEMLREQSDMLATTTTSIQLEAADVDALHSQLLGELGDLQDTLQTTRNQTSILMESTGLEDEAFELFLIAEDALNRTQATNETIAGIEEDLVGAASSIVQTRRNVLDASQALDAAEEKFDSIEMFLNATQETVTQFVFNTSAFIAENERIISEIDDIIASLADIHSRVNRINSPIQLSDSNMELSYLSLQPPPGRILDDTIQFETLDIYLWTGSDFDAPSLLFYAGPVYDEETDNINDQGGEPSNEDYILLTVELGSMLQLQWSMGGIMGTFLSPGFQLGFSQLFIARQGSQFQIRYGVRTGDLGSPDVMGDSNNGSLLFRTSNRTAFLLGGWPTGAQLGLPDSVISLDGYNTFQGQVQLLLFNGQQWGLWNIRGASTTDFIGNFQRSQLASSNTWRAPRDQASSTPSISFDGDGYLFAEQMGSVQDFTGRRTITIITRPNEERDGLVLFAYDRDLEVSVEVAYMNGDLRLLIRRYDIDNGLLVDYTQSPTAAIISSSASEGRAVSILFVEGFGFQINGEENFLVIERSLFFTDLTNVRVWYGGVSDEDLLESPFIPEMLVGYWGCIDITAQADFLENIFSGNHFTNFYLNSDIMRGFTATCLTSIYTSSVAFAGSTESYLSYLYLNLVTPPNSPASLVGGASANEARVISFSIVAQSSDGVLLTKLSEESYLAVLLRNSLIQVQVNTTGTGGIGVVLDSSKQLQAGVQQYILIELSPDSYSLFVDGELQMSLPSIAGLTIELDTTVTSSESPALYLGGIPGDLDLPGLPSGVSPFTGCMTDLSFNFRHPQRLHSAAHNELAVDAAGTSSGPTVNAMSFINPSLPLDRRYPDGITYHTCPFINVTLQPHLAVHPDAPVGRACLGDTPPTVAGTHGGFHGDTNLATSNIIGFISSSWTLSMDLRQVNDGHVLTIRSILGHMIRLTVQGGRAVLELSETVGGSGSDASGGGGTINGTVLQEGVFTPVAINCNVDDERMLLSCWLSVNGSTATGQPLEATYNQRIFFPQLPLQFGTIDDDESGYHRDSFVGCISNLATNGDTSGFSNIQTNLECYARTRLGNGYSGITYLSTLLPEVSGSETTQTASVTFQPQLDNGLVLIVTNENGSLPLLAVGIFNGELRLSLFNNDTSYFLLSSSVCEPDNPIFYTISLTFTATNETAKVAMEGGTETTVQFPSAGESLLLTVGNLPPGFTIPDGLFDPFRFLLSANLAQDSLPPGLFGCVNSIVIGSNTIVHEEAESENVLVGFCPSV